MIWRTVTLFSVAMFGAYIGHLVYDRDPPVIVYSAKPQGPVEPGGILRIEYVLNRFRQCETTVDRAIFDSRNTRFLLEPLVLVTGAGPVGQERYVSEVPVPIQAALGPAVYRTTSRFKCNIANNIWPIYAPSREVAFTIGP